MTDPACEQEAARTHQGSKHYVDSVAKSFVCYKTVLQQKPFTPNGKHKQKFILDKLRYLLVLPRFIPFGSYTVNGFSE